MSSRKLPWVLWELDRASKRASLYGGRCILCLMSACVFSVLLVERLGDQRMVRTVPFLSFACVILFFVTFFVMRRFTRNMRGMSFTEERQEGTLPLLLCTPHHSFAVVFQKWIPMYGTYVGHVLVPLPVLVIYVGAVGTHGVVVGLMLIWLLAFIAYATASRVLISSTLLNAKLIESVCSIFLMLPWVFGFMLHAIGPLKQKAAVSSVLTFLCPPAMLVTNQDPRIPFLVSTVLYMIIAALFLFVASRIILRQPDSPTGQWKLYTIRISKRLRRIIPIRAVVEEWMLRRYTVGWLGIRNYPWIATPSIILVAGIAGLVAVRRFFSQEPADELSGPVASLLFFIGTVLLIVTPSQVSRVLNEDLSSRMNELLTTLPMTARQIALSRVMENLIRVGPSFLALGILTALALAWRSPLGGVCALITSLEFVTVSTVMCLGTHLSARLTKSLLDPGIWTLSGVGLVIIFAIPTSLALANHALETSELCWIFASLGRLVVDLAFVWMLFHWFVSKLNSTRA